VLLFSAVEKVTASSSALQSVVSHNVTDVAGLVDRAVDVLWPSRYDTKSWDCLRPESVNVVDDNSTVEARSQAAYQRLVLDVTAETVTSLCDNTTSTDTSQPWRPSRTIVSRPAPQSADEARPLVNAAVLQLLGLESRKRQVLPRYLGQVRGRRNADQVDEVLSAELVEEESSWTDYTDDESCVKMQLTDMLFDVMVSDTVSSVADIVARKCQPCHRHD